MNFKFNINDNSYAGNYTISIKALLNDSLSTTNNDLKIKLILLYGLITTTTTSTKITTMTSTTSTTMTTTKEP